MRIQFLAVALFQMDICIIYMELIYWLVHSSGKRGGGGGKGVDGWIVILDRY